MSGSSSMRCRQEWATTLEQSTNSTAPGQKTSPSASHAAAPPQSRFDRAGLLDGLKPPGSSEAPSVDTW